MKSQTVYICPLHARLLFFQVICLVLVCTASPLLWAGDGQIDILPSGSKTLAISNPGSYVLTDNVVMTADVSCIEITASNVTLDLNGHTLLGTGSGAASGIDGGDADNVTVYNGKVKNFSVTGIHLKNGARLYDLKVDTCSDGIKVGEEAHIYRVNSSSNSKVGIFTSSGSLVEKCITNNNGGDGQTMGIRVGDNCIVQDCICKGNKSCNLVENNAYGIYASDSCRIVSNVCTDNHVDSPAKGEAIGIKTGNHCVIKDNTCGENKVNSESASHAMGIDCSFNCVISGNTCNENQTKGLTRRGCGILCSAGSVVTGNTCYANSYTGTGGAGEGVGIYAEGANTLIRGNTCSVSQGDGSFNAMGIYIKYRGCRVEDNICSMQSGGNVSAGIFLEDGQPATVVIRNTTHGNQDVGISMGNDENYCAENMTAETTGINNTTDVTMGTGDRANVSY